MKLLPAKKRKVCIVFAGGLGDSLLYVPLLKALKKKQFHITALFYGRDDNDCLFDSTLYDKKIRINSKSNLLFFAVANFKHFSNFYVNHLANGKLVNRAGRICSTHVSRTDVHQENTSKKDRKVIHEFSDAEQNLHLLFSTANAAIQNINEFHLSVSTIPDTNGKLMDSNRYLVLQVSSGNNQTPYKNWPIENWLALVEQLCNNYPSTHFFIVGDNNETSHRKDFENMSQTNCHVLIGETTVKQVFDLVANSAGYIGLDSGIMHMAVALNKRTLTIFGASDEKLYGYSNIDALDHKIISLPIYCRPCSAWKDANTLRVTDPMKCPDFACVTGIKVETVYSEVISHFEF
jgi:ADP-heptose:LPS heptosyltransferase